MDIKPIYIEVKLITPDDKPIIIFSEFEKPKESDYDMNNNTDKRVTQTLFRCSK